MSHAFRALPVRPWRRHLRRALGAERNDLARPLDRARSRALLVSALAVLAAALLGAASAWADLSSAERHASAAAPHVHRLDAVLLTPARPTTGSSSAALTSRYQADAAWTYPVGQRNVGTVKLAWQAGTGTTVGIWVGDAGKLVAAPPNSAGMVSDAVFGGLFVLGGLSALAGCGLGLRLNHLNRRADAAWQRAWAGQEPVWTGRAARKPGNGDSPLG
ncbi:hypothetical protein ABT095_01245 [Kitasatospora sp. NPDC002227]|uniref:Rv1733c family protein n=1 Tax=Kitasatospora sp. NPDC002227 TaxID=3154773 RepID=UPI003322BDD7